MIVSIRDVIVLHGGFSSIAEGLKALGLKALEVHVGRDLRVLSITGRDSHHRLDEGKALRDWEETLQRHGITVTAFLLANDFGKPDADEQVAWIIKTIQLANRLGIATVRVDAIVSGWEGMGERRAIRLFADHIKGVIEATEGTEVHLGVENHGPLGNRPEFLQAVLEAVDSPRFGLTLDTGNFYWFGHPLSHVYEIQRQFAPRVKHTHIKNIRYPKDLREQRRPIGYEYRQFVCPIPDGDIDHRRIVEILRDAGYKGDLCIEDESLGKFSPKERGQILRRDADYLKALLS